MPLTNESNDVNDTLKELEHSGQAQAVERYGYRFWSASPSHYSQKTATGQSHSTFEAN